MVTMREFEADPQGARYSDVFAGANPSFRSALEVALGVLNQSEARRRMREAVDLHNLPALAGAVRAIEETAEFQQACRGRPRASLRRLKQAVGVACKLVMGEEGFAPRVRRDARPDQARLRPGTARWFTTARCYAPTTRGRM